MATFKINDKVTSREDVQGLVRGVVYTVLDVKEYPSMFGSFVTYYLNDPFTPEQVKHAVNNGHLILEKS
jgi:hypothetical protein